MISSSRSFAKRLWDVFRRVSPRKGRAVTQNLRIKADGRSLCARLAVDDFTVDFALDGPFGLGDVTIPLDVLGSVQGATKDIVELHSPEPGKVLVRWQDAGVPQSLALDVPVEAVEFGPANPPCWESNTADLARSLVEVGKVAAKESIRFAMNRICLRGGKGDVVATDGRQLLRCGGFGFPWSEDVLDPVMPILAAAEFHQDSAWDVGMVGDVVMLRTGPWTISVRADRKGRFPAFEQVIPRSSGNGADWRIAKGDADYLARTLPRLPGKDDDSSPVTIDLNGHVSVRSRAADQPQVTEIVLSRSNYTGKPVKLVCDRKYLLRAVQLGMEAARIEDPDRPIVFESMNRLYLFMPLPSKSALAATDDATRLESDSSLPTQQPPRSRPMELKIPATEVPRDIVAKPDRETSEPPTLLAEAQALREHLHDGFRRANELVRSLKRQHRQSKLVASTLASLRQLQTIDA